MAEAKSSGIITKDYWTIITLENCGHVPVLIEPVETRDGRSTVLVYTFSDDAMEDYDAWMRGETKEPFGTIRRVQQSAVQFKNNLHRYQCR